jgi:hypothetical protein
MSLIYPSHIKIQRPERVIKTQKPQILEPQGTVWALDFGTVTDIYYLNMGTLGNFGQQLSFDWTVCWRQNMTTVGTSIQDVCGSNNAGVNTLFQLLLDFASGIGFSDGDFTLSFRDEDGGGATALTAPGILIDGIWQNIAVTRSGNTASIYCDGIFQTSLDVSVINNTANFQFPFFVGCLNNVGVPFFIADIILEYFYIYNRALSADEIKYAAEHPQDLPDQRDAEALWRLQEGFGTAVDPGGAAKVQDELQNHNGTMVGFAGSPWVNIGVR